MDVLKPPIVNVGGRFYRKILTSESRGCNESEQAPYIEDEFTCDDGPCVIDDIKLIEQGYQIQINVPSAFYGYIIGKKGETRKRIETETGANIIIPKGQANEVITIKSEVKKNVAAARDRINLLVESARRRQPFTHFLSIPLITPKITEAVNKFKTDVLKTCSQSEGLHETMFQKSQHLHLTLGTMVLMNKHEVDKAINLLEKCRTSIISAILHGEPLKVSLSGLEYMNDDPAEVDVLYCKVQPTDNSNKLQLLVDSVAEQFINEGLMVREYDHVKIHATLINSLFNRDSELGNHEKVYSKNQKIRKSFDARVILEIFGDCNLSTCDLAEMHISIRGTKSTNYYCNEAVITLC
ncbi:activating signal cointegrator 1 complex subunit 1-like isoform X2 [Antedon mediterranea]